MKSRLIKLVLGILVAVLLVCLMEGVLSFVFLKKDYAAYVAQQPKAVSFKEEFHAQHDSEIGWVHIPGKVIKDFYGPNRNITINQQGVRATREYGKENNLVVLGDSFTLGYGVDDQHTFPAYLQKMMPGKQVINMGQGGYSAGQCMLWYQRDGGQFNAELLVFAIIVDDIWRMGSTLSANGYAKPEFKLVDGKLKVSGVPLPPKIEAGDHLVDLRKKAAFYSERSALMRLMKSAVPVEPPDQEAMYKMMEAVIDEIDHPNMVVVLLPEWRDMVDANQRKLYLEIARRLNDFSRARTFDFYDLMPAFLQRSPQEGEKFFLNEQWRHYSEAGNAYVAQHLHDFLSQRSGNRLESQP